MKTINVTPYQTTKQPYPIYIGSDLLSKIDSLFPLSRYSKAAIITDTIVANFHLQPLIRAIKIPHIEIFLQPGEKEKNIDSTKLIWQKLAENNFDRKSVIFNLGGGVIGDMGGFAASTYMRGVDFVNIPTTVLAQVDESVGGKTGIDFGGIKNLIGTFNQPKAVIIDIATVKTLPDREFNSGFAEIIKHGLIADKKYFETVTTKKPREFSDEELETIIADSCEIKRNVVEDDINEKGVRKILNFGHTIGHAIEAISLDTNKPLLHGESISIGIVAEAKLSSLKNYLSDEDVNEIKNALSKSGLPVSAEKIDKEAIFEKIKSDKKNISGKVQWTLLREIGSALHDEEVDDALVSQAIDFISHE